ncbi:hypothetical protein [Rudanella lutea]|uniref:hypothetical protein n=1 Tax=Rudanella lutea TaxID=451374 RepID=UPI00036FB2EB|nr:hypothetical protein [Rudanella lutea]
MDVFETHFPAGASAYARGLWQEYKFGFTISRPRRTRLGDFRALPDGSLHISVNADLNPYAFLITYVHEVAHAAVHRAQPQGRRRAAPKPHGPQWQQTFADLMRPVLTAAVFPEAILTPLRDYLRQPAASSHAHPGLMAALRSADPQPTGRVLLQDLPEGSAFRLAKKTFVRGTVRRTRIVCKEVASGRSYAILAHALVEMENG